MRNLLLCSHNVYGEPPFFSVVFTKGNNLHDFLFASLLNKNVPKGGILLK